MATGFCTLIFFVYICNEQKLASCSHIVPENDFIKTQQPHGPFLLQGKAALPFYKRKEY